MRKQQAEGPGDHGLTVLAHPGGPHVPGSVPTASTPLLSHPQTYEHNEWIIHLAGKLLANDREALSLLAFNPFKDRAPPR